MNQVTSEMIDLYNPDLVPGKHYDVASIVVPVVASASYPPIAIRMACLPDSALPEQIEYWVRSLKRVANTAARQL